MSRTRATTPDDTLQREFEMSMVDVDESRGNGNERVGSGATDFVDDDVDDRDDRDDAEMAEDDEFDDHQPPMVDDGQPQMVDDGDGVDEDDVDDDRAEMAEDDEFDAGQADKVDADEFDDDQAEMVNDGNEYNDEAETVLDVQVDVDNDRAAVPTSRLVSRERASTSAKEPRRRAPHMSPQLTDGVRYLLNRYELAHSSAIPQNVAVVSALSGEGVTTVSQALAEVLAVDFSVSVCWVDFSWTSNRRGPSRSGFSSDAGLYDVLLERAELDDVLVTTPGSAVTYLPSGEVAEDDRHAMVRWPHLSDVIAELRSSFDHVVFDSAPLLANSDALALLRYVDAHLLVTKHGATTIRQVKATASELETIPSLGALLNKYNPSTPSFIRRLFSE